MKQGVSPSPSGKEALLVLEDGTSFCGVGFGAVGRVEGEVVFNTGMVGYTELITDPTYKGQILIQTYPLIGNYGVSPDHFESDGPKIEGYVVRDLCRRPSHWTSKMTVDEWLERSGVPGIEGADTRLLTRKVRVHGSMLGVLYTYQGGEVDVDALLEEVKQVSDPNKRDLVSEVATKEVVKHDAGGKFNVVLIDCGVKRSIIRSLIAIGLNVIQVPPTTHAKKILDINPDGVVISNGPGDPKMVPYVTKAVKELVSARIPMFGIGLGNQIVALALGCDTEKLKFGHRGQNHPCLKVGTNQCFMTNQNHGYVVKTDSIAGSGLKVTFINANDRTIEGLAHTKLPISAVQFHPEASPNFATDTQFIFDSFLKTIKAGG